MEIYSIYPQFFGEGKTMSTMVEAEIFPISSSEHVCLLPQNLTLSLALLSSSLFDYFSGEKSKESEIYVHPQHVDVFS